MPWEIDSSIIRSHDCFPWHLHHNVFNLVERISCGDYLVKVVNATARKIPEFLFKSPCAHGLVAKYYCFVCRLHVLITKIARLPYIGTQVTQKLSKLAKVWLICFKSFGKAHECQKYCVIAHTY